MSAKLEEELKVLSYDFDQTSAAAEDAAWVDMKDYDEILVVVMHSVGTGDLTSFKLLGNNISDGSGTDVTLKTHAIGTQPDAVGDCVVLGVTKDDIVAASEGGARYVSANLDFATSTDEGVVTYLRRSKTQKAGETADVIA